MAALLAVGPAPAGAATPTRRSACVTRAFKTMNLTTTKARCPRGQYKISWNVYGPKGSAGDAGSPGADGPSGPQGPVGVQSAKGDTDAKGEQDDVGPLGLTGVGVRGENVNAANSRNAIEGVANGSGAGIVGQGTTAGLFNGNVQINGNLTVTGTKSGVQIDDPRAPTERTLTRTPVETDALTVVYTGNVTTGDDGRATVQLPDHATVLAGRWRYQLTPIGKFGQAIVADEVDGDGRFVVRTEHGDTKVSWSVTGVRKDPQARKSAIVPVKPKSASDEGTYLDPSLYDAPAQDASVVDVKPATREDGTVNGQDLTSTR